jgi:hypothetical protein
LWRGIWPPPGRRKLVPPPLLPLPSTCLAHCISPFHPPPPSHIARPQQLCPAATICHRMMNILQRGYFHLVVSSPLIHTPGLRPPPPVGVASRITWPWSPWLPTPAPPRCPWSTRSYGSAARRWWGRSSRGGSLAPTWRRPQRGCGTHLPAAYPWNRCVLSPNPVSVPGSWQGYIPWWGGPGRSGHRM